MKLLSICIPTYNRPEDIRHLHGSFLNKVLDLYEQDVEVIICDNSDPELAKQNFATCDSRVKYYKNEKNIGFAGNVLQCTKLASAEYLWLLPDNDEIIWHGFEVLFDALQTRDVDCFLLPYQTMNIKGEHIEVSYPFLDKCTKLNLHNVIAADDNFLPFVLLSSGVVRLNKGNIDRIGAILTDNIFIQVSLLMAMLNDNSSVKVLAEPVINYKIERRGRFAPVDLFDSYHALLKHLSLSYKSIESNCLQRLKLNYRATMILLLNHYSGLLVVHGVKRSRMHFLSRLFLCFDFMNLFLYFLVILPEAISGRIYLAILARSYVRSHQRLSPRGWISAYLEGYNQLCSKRLENTKAGH